MGGYIANFTVYTMAMIGLICFAIFVFKKFTDGTMRSNNTKFLSIEDSMTLSPRKTLHVIRAGNEKFLIASDIDSTTLISKLEWNKMPEMKNIERFRDIPPAEPIYNNISLENQTSQIQNENIVHLEPIYQNRKHNARKNTLDTRASSTSVTSKRAITQKQQIASPMKEMAKRINEL